MYIHKLPAAFAPARLPEFAFGSNADRSRRTICSQAPETFVRAVARNVDVPNEKRVGHDRGAVTCRCDVALAATSRSRVRKQRNDACRGESRMRSGLHASSVQTPGVQTLQMRGTVESQHTQAGHGGGESSWFVDRNGLCLTLSFVNNRCCCLFGAKISQRHRNCDLVV